MRILLSGFMGAGKTTVGRLLAERLGVPFRDLDQMIESRAGASVREIFERSGEGEFRRMEAEELDRACELDPVVIALGGGTMSAPGGVERARSRGLVLWLHPPFATIVGRIGASGKADRPLFRDETSAFELYRSRLPDYRQSDRVVEIETGEGAAEVASRVALELERSFAGRPCST